MYPLSEIQNLSKLNSQEIVRIRGKVFSKKDCGLVLFLIIRDGINTLQALVTKSKAESNSNLSIEAYNTLRKIENESFIEIIGKLNLAKKSIKACSQKWIELEITNFNILNRSVLALPITLKEAERTEEQQNENTLLPSIQFFKRLDNRVLDLRTNLSQAIFCIYDGFLFYAQQYLRKQGFVEIKTPKLIGGSSEGGADVFKLDYFGQPACLAQSPQLYKQMAIISDFKRVFEIGPVFRAENSNSNRHLTEFIGIDLEIVIDKSYIEVVHLVYNMCLYLFDKVNSNYSRELEIIKSFFHLPQLIFTSEVVIIEFQNAITLLREGGKTIEDLDDLTTENEKKLGEIVKHKYHTDLYVITKYPSNVRPFYTMPSQEDTQYSNSYDFMLRGEEILSGAQRIHDYTMLSQRVNELGIDQSSILNYINSFKYGTPPHAGAGIGLERLLKCFLGLPDIRYCNLFPRDPKRLYP